MSEFSKNNADSETTGMFPFFANYGYHSQIQIDQSPARRQEDPQARTSVETLQKLQDVLRPEIVQT